MSSAVKCFCTELSASRLFSPKTAEDLSGRWKEEAGADAPDDLQAFIQWLLRRHELTPYQVGWLLGGHGDLLFLGPYKILDRAGEGALTRVYRAQDKDGTPVALKVLPLAKSRDPRLLAYFHAAARLGRRLRHANLVRTFQTGASDGLHYLVLEYLEGESLERLLRRRGRLPWPEAVHMIHQALMGLQYLHGRGIVHGNLEPANLMLVPETPGGPLDSTLRSTVKILDTGMGRALFEELAEASRPEHLCNGEGVVHDRLEDVAPEQLSNPGSGDIRADLFSLGCILYHCLTGQTPFPGRSLLQQVIGHATDQPAAVTTFDPAIPQRLCQVLDKMMAKDPADRYPGPVQAAQALAAVSSAPSDNELPPSPTPAQFDKEALAAAPPAPDAAPPADFWNTPLPSASAEPLSEQPPHAAGAGRAPRPISPIKWFAAIAIGALPSILFYFYWTGYFSGSRQPTQLAQASRRPTAVKTTAQRPTLTVRNEPIASSAGRTTSAAQTSPEAQAPTKPARTPVEGNPPAKSESVKPVPAKTVEVEVPAEEKPARPPVDPPSVTGPPAKEKPAPLEANDEPASRHSTSPEVKTPATLETLPPGVKLPPGVEPSASLKSRDPRDANGKVPVPDEARQARAEKLIKEVFQPEYAKKAAADRRALGVRLLKQGKETRDDLDARYVLFREASSLAAQAGDVATAFRAVDELAREYAVNARRLKTSALAMAGHAAATPAAGKAVVEVALAEVDQAVHDDDYEAALALLVVAETAAQRTGGAVLVRKVGVRGKEVAEIRSEHARVKLMAAGLEKLQAAGAQPDAEAEYSLVLGKFLCFMKGDWTRGLPLLAKGTDANLKALAADDLAAADNPAALVQLADRWWDLAASFSGIPRREIQRRACQRYQRALPDLAGLTRTKVERRVAQAAE
jgi:serine/threonine protein kinase